MYIVYIVVGAVHNFWLLAFKFVVSQSAFEFVTNRFNGDATDDLLL